MVREFTPKLDVISTLKGVIAYRDLFKATKVWGEGRRPSPEALLRRLAQGKGLYTINTAVDAYNLAVIETGIGLGGFDLNRIKLPITLRFTSQGETLHLLGDDRPTLTQAGELAYADGEKLITLDVNYRDIDTTKITLDTQDIILFADGAPGLSETEVLAALKKGAEYIQQFCGGQIGSYQLVNSTSKQIETYGYYERKIVCIVDRDLPPGKLANAIGHLAFAGGHQAEDTWFGRPELVDADGNKHPGIAKYPIIILQASKPYIKQIHEQALTSKLMVHDFPEEMFNTGHDDELSQLLAKADKNSLSYEAILIAGNADEVNKLTSKLKLYG